jgi:hypothetical protein
MHRESTEEAEVALGPNTKPSGFAEGKRVFLYHPAGEAQKFVRPYHGPCI